MKSAHIVLLLTSAALIALVAWRFGAREAPRPPNTFVTDPQAEPQALAPAGQTAPAVGVAHPAARERNEQLALEIERGLVARDQRQRETALTLLLPELLQADPERVASMVARQAPGEARDALRDEVARLWIVHDRDAAVAWMESLDSETERRASAQVAMRRLAAIAPDQAITVADQFGVGRDDGYLEYMVQMWAETDLAAATRWLETQPDDARTAPLRARIELVRGRHPSTRS